MTHIGMDKRKLYLIELRETNNCWITKYGRKYNKQTESWIGKNQPTFELDINTIKELNEN
jgi:hypothetical protein